MRPKPRGGRCICVWLVFLASVNVGCVRLFDSSPPHGDVEGRDVGTSIDGAHDLAAVDSSRDISPAPLDMIVSTTFTVLQTASLHGGISVAYALPDRLAVASESFAGNKGRAWILDLNGNVLHTMSPVAGDGSVPKYGESIDFDGTNLLIGLPCASFGSFAEAGRIAVVSTMGVRVATLQLNAPQTIDYFGTGACALDDGSIVAPAYFHDKLARFDASYVQQSQVKLPSALGFERHQRIVATSTRIITGGYTAAYDGYTKLGVLRVFDHNLVHQAAVKVPAGYRKNGQHFGQSLVASSSHVYSGLLLADVSKQANAGAVLMVDPAGPSLVRVIVAPTPLPGDQFGYKLWYDRATAELFVATRTARIYKYAVSGTNATLVRVWDGSAYGAKVNGTWLQNSMSANATYLFLCMNDGNILRFDRS